MHNVAAIAVRKGDPSDLPDLVRIDEFAHSHPERTAVLRGALAAGECFLATVDRDVAGYVVLNYNFFGFGFIPLVVVASSQRRRGIGLQLVRHAQLHCRSRKLFTSANASNEAAHALFVRAGFVRSGVIDNLDEHDPEVVFFVESGAT